MEPELLKDLHHTPIHGQGRGSSSSSVVIQSQRKVHSHLWHSWSLQCPRGLPMLFWLWHLEVFAFSTHLVQGLLSPVLSQCWWWLEVKATPGQSLGLCWGCAHGAILVLLRVTAAAPAAPPAGLSLSTGPPLPSPSTALSLQGCSQLTQHRVCPKANP